MTYMIAAFSSRNSTIQFFNLLNSNRINVSLISTPRAAFVGCGLSVKFNNKDFSIVKALANSSTGFGGFFAVSEINGKVIVTRV